MTSAERLRFAAFCAYIASWLVLAIAAAISAIPRRQRQPQAIRITTPVAVGVLLQTASVCLITFTIGEGPLRPRPFELIGALALAPLAAALFVWALRSIRRHADADALLTTGAYRWLRHPIYLAFLAMLLATGLLASSGIKLIGAAILYLAGSELRIASEEADLASKFPSAYALYRQRTRWRYLPGLR